MSESIEAVQGECIFYCLTVMCTHCWNINRSHNGLFLYSPCMCVCCCSATLQNWRL